MAKVSKSTPPGLVNSFRKGICAAFAPKNDTLALGGGTDVVFFDCKTGDELRRTEKTEDSRGNIGGIAYSADGKRIAITHMNGIVSICDSKSGQRLHRLASAPSDHAGLTDLHQIGKLAHAGKERTINVWTGKAERVTIHSQHPPTSNALLLLTPVTSSLPL